MNIVITGASRGIGFEIAKQLTSTGNHEIVAISRNGQGLKAFKDACNKSNLKVHLSPIEFDLASKVSFSEHLIPQIKQHISSIDILINNAGYLVNKPLLELSDADAEQMVNVNFTSAFKLIKATLPLMTKNSHVVNIGSMGGFQGSSKFLGLSVYSASKAALACLTECCAEETKGSGVSFNCLALGAVSTEMLSEAFPGYKAPLSAKEMATFIVDFALNGNKYFNGKILPVTISTP